MFTSSLLGLLLIGTPMTAQIVIADKPVIPIVQTVDLTSTSSIKRYVQDQAVAKGVDPKIATAIVECESHYIAKQSEHLDPDGPNGREDSWGIWQINLPGKKITREQAMSIIWSTEWSLNALNDGFTKWTCYPK